jgi:hypothetical protein
MNVKESKEFCDDVYVQLTDMKDKILQLKERAGAACEKSASSGGKFTRQLTELAADIEWRLQILSHSCSHDWTGAADFEGDAQVDEMGRSADHDKFSGGYVGG